MKRCTICDLTPTGDSVYNPEVASLNSGVYFLEDGHGNTICSRCSDTILETLAEMEEEDDDLEES